MAKGYPEAFKIEALRRVLVLKLGPQAVAAAMGCSRTVVNTWLKSERLCGVARALGAPTTERQPGPVSVSGYDGDGEGPPPYAVELPDADPLNPGPVTLAAMAAAYKLTDDLETLDDLCMWPRGSTALWWEDAEGFDDVDRLRELLAQVPNRRSVAVVRQCRRERAIADLGLIERMGGGKAGWRAAHELLKARRPAEFDPAVDGVDDGVDELEHMSATDLAIISGVEMEL